MEKDFWTLWSKVIRATKLLHKSTNHYVKEPSNNVTLRKKIIFAIILLSSWSYIMCEFDPKCLICLNSEDWIIHNITGFLNITKGNGN